MTAVHRLVLAAALTAGCACHRGPAAFLAAAPGEPWVRTELMFGLAAAGGKTVAPAEWQDFLDTAVTPRFPAGLTVVDAAGQWRNAQGRITAEPSKVLILLHPPDPGAQAKIEEIRAIYRKRFGQESVLRATSPAKVSF